MLVSRLRFLGARFFDTGAAGSLGVSTAFSDAVDSALPDACAAFLAMIKPTRALD